MWAVHHRSTEEWGKEKHKGGPRKWEARQVRHERRATTFVVVRFHYPSFHAPPTDVSNAPTGLNDTPTL